MNMSKGIAVAVALAGLACTQDEGATLPDRVAETHESLVAERDEYQKEVRSALTELEGNVSEVKQKLERSRAMRAHYAQRVVELESQLRNARYQVESLEGLASEDWDSARAEMDRTLAEMRAILAGVGGDETTGAAPAEPR